jgi:quinoprotein glucose dehydrogenase
MGQVSSYGAIDLRNGQTLWDRPFGSGRAIRYSVSVGAGNRYAEHYLLIMAGGHHFMETPVGDYVIA